eukprot:499118-Rhodomonas_salina.1
MEARQRVLELGIVCVSLLTIVFFPALPRVSELLLLTPGALRRRRGSSSTLRTPSGSALRRLSSQSLTTVSCTTRWGSGCCRLCSRAESAW